MQFILGSRMFQIEIIIKVTKKSKKILLCVIDLYMFIFNMYNYSLGCFSSKEGKFVFIYSANIKNEIDFDMATFKYDNILESQHIGIEISTGIYRFNSFRYNNTINLSEVSFGTGDQKGKMLKNIPKISQFYQII